MISQTRLSPQLTATKLRQIFGTVHAHSCPSLLNFHLHTVFSDGQMQPHEVVNQAINLNLAHIAITDHHTVDGYYQAHQILQQNHSYSLNSKLPHLHIGIEINASLLFTEVHILGYGFDPTHPFIEPYLQGKTTAGIDYQAKSVINSIHNAGGIAVLAHPARYRRSPEELVPAAAALGIDGIETYYCYTNSMPWKPSVRQTQQVKQLGDRYELLHTCGTDSHGFSIATRL
ncbi:putative metal-dependent phosphoesterase, PHP family [Synechococcus sp. PCC 7502]|uniref:PHP domain-containing protein n=1 Tax=Synechococcus sp. PCC 7502 TaxID=1173263 RepID=UPI00029FDC97|nr:PHP domain-containing protein [Synechococcus sp. PCC 7502]AFY74004.1 putative metal-dependent phosphoesterase, PHP family [Synechococcus sp. PCC 7502]